MRFAVFKMCHKPDAARIVLHLGQIQPLGSRFTITHRYVLPNESIATGATLSFLLRFINIALLVTLRRQGRQKGASSARQAETALRAKFFVRAVLVSNNPLITVTC